MIELTPLDIRKKKDDLRKAMRGYDMAQVDSFLDIVADRLEQVVQENRTLRERINGLAEQLEAYKEREHALNEALVTAQELREEARAQARRESALKLKEAEVQAKQLVERAERSVQTSAGRMEELRSRRRHFLESFRDTLRRYMEELEVEERRLSAELATGDDTDATIDETPVESAAEGATAGQATTTPGVVASDAKVKASVAAGTAKDSEVE